MKETGWTPFKIDKSLRFYSAPCLERQRKFCEKIGFCLRPLLTTSKAERYLKKCRKITFRRIQIAQYSTTCEFMTLSKIKILGIALND